MKKTLLVIGILLLTNLSFSQRKPRIEKSIAGIQIGFLGIDFYNESRLSENTALRSEFNFNSGIWGGTLYNKTGFIMFPSITIQPKYYYNLGRRIKKGKNIQNNGANYLSIQAKYTPNWFVISNHKDIEVTNNIAIIPTYGLRRNFGKNFNYEFKVGLGYGTTIGEKKNSSGVILDLGFKIGYDF